MLKLRIVTPERIAYNGEAESILVPGTLGQFEVLTNHAPIISSLECGVVEYRNGDGKHQLPIIGGFIEVKQNEVSLCVEVE